MEARKKIRGKLILITLIILAIESFIQLELLEKVNLDSAKASSVSTFDFRENLFPEQKWITVFNIALSLMGIHFFLRSINVRSTFLLVPLTSTLLISNILFLGSLFSFFTVYWPQGVAYSLFFTSIISQVYIVFLFSAEDLVKRFRIRLALDTIISHFSSRRLRRQIYFLVYSFVIVYPVAIVARNYFIWDYVGQEGRFAMQQAFLFSPFPLESFSFPGELLAYHFGFDGIVATASSLLNLPLDLANILISYFLLFVLFSSLIALCKVVFPQLSSAKQALVATTGLYSGGLPFYWGSTDLADLYLDVAPNFDLKGLWILPPTTSFFFQRSFGIGLPIFICLILLHFNKGFANKSSVLFCAKALLICGLAVSNTTLAVTTVSILLLVLFMQSVNSFQTKSFRLNKELLESFWLLLIQIFSLLLFNGFFRFLSGNENAADKFGIGVCGHLESCFDYLNWFVLSFSISIFGIFFSKAFRIIWIVSLTGILVNFFLDFSGSPDGVKFAVAPRLFLSIGLMAQILQFNFQAQVARVVAISIVGLTSMASAITFLMPLAIQSGSKDIFSFTSLDSQSRRTEGPIRTVGIAKRILTSRVVTEDGKDRDGFVCSPSMINYCGTYGGLQQYKVDLLSIQIKSEQIQRVIDSPVSISKYQKQGFNYLVVSKLDESWWEYAVNAVKTNRATELYREEGFVILQFRAIQS